MAVTAQAAPKRTSQSITSLAWRRFRRHRLAMASLVVIFLLVVMALAAPLIAPHDPSRSPGARICGRSFSSRRAPNTS